MWTVKGRRKKVKKNAAEVLAMESLNKKNILAKIYCFNQLLFGEAVLLKRAVMTSTVLFSPIFLSSSIFSAFCTRKTGQCEVKEKR